MGLFRLWSFRILVCSALLLGGCTANLAPLASALNGSSTSTSASSTSVPGGARAVKIIFTQSNTGSFDAPDSNGTAVTPGSGLQATRIFNADSSLLASGSTSTAWPPWFSSFELGISGSKNTASQNPGCARFATAAEGAGNNCKLKGTTTCPASGTDSRCEAAANQFRVSEVDCSLNAPVTSNGNGGASDGVYFRANFSRNTTYLANTENILVNLEYAATSVNPAPTSPTACFTGGTFSPELCSDFVWRAYIKHSPSEVVQPYLLLIPPTFGSVLGVTAGGTSNGGTLISTRQFIIPLAGDTDLTTLQVSRIQSNFPGDQTSCGNKAYNLKFYCHTNGLDIGGTPLCAGVIFYSITFFRI